MVVLASLFTREVVAGVQQYPLLAFFFFFVVVVVSDGLAQVDAGSGRLRDATERLGGMDGRPTGEVLSSSGRRYFTLRCLTSKLRKSLGYQSGLVHLLQTRMSTNQEELHPQASRQTRTPRLNPARKRLMVRGSLLLRNDSDQYPRRTVSRLLARAPLLAPSHLGLLRLALDLAQVLPLESCTTAVPTLTSVMPQSTKISSA